MQRRHELTEWKPYKAPYMIWPCLAIAASNSSASLIKEPYKT